MNFLETLKQFKAIQPDPHFSEKSKRLVLAMPQKTQPARSMPGFWGILETGIAVVLAGFFIVLITGIFPGASYLTPVQYSVIDPQGLHAEAQAIDMQIQLTNVNYPEVPVVPKTPPKSAAPTTKASGIKPNSFAPLAASQATGTATSTTSSTVSMEQALEQLTQ